MNINGEPSPKVEQRSTKLTNTNNANANTGESQGLLSRLKNLKPREILHLLARKKSAKHSGEQVTTQTEEYQRIFDPEANEGKGGYVKRIYDPETDTLARAKGVVSIESASKTTTNNSDFITNTNNPNIQSNRMQELIDLADSPAAASLLRTDLTSDEITIILQERERLHQERAQRIEEQVPDDILLPTADSLLHRTDTIDHVLGMLDNGLWVRNPRGLDTTAERLQKRTDDQEENGNTKHTNAKKLAARHSPGGHMSRFVVMMTFPRVMPLEVQKVYDEMDPTERRGYGRMNAYLDWDNIPEDAQLSHIFAVLPSKYMTGVVDQDTGQYYTKEQFKQEFGAL